MEKKIRYKLHKVKKQWVTIAVTSMALVGVGVGVACSTHEVSADETNVIAVTRGRDTPASSSSQTQTSAATEQSQETTTEASSTEETVVADDSQKTTDVTSAKADDKTAESSTEASEETKASSEETTKPSEATSTETSETSETNPSEESHKATDEEVRDDKTNKAADSDAEKAAVDQLSLDNIKKIDGKYYYIQEDGTVKKNFAITVNGQLLYFDAETGALSSTSTYSFTEGLTDLVDNFSKNNQAYDSTEKSFELVDGYLTANSWYRPTKVLDNGEKWVDSTKETFRPLVMAWWPDVDTQVNYLNHMSEYFGMDKKYSATDKQSTLNVAAEAIQIKIEQEIKRRGDVAWLRDIIASFVSTQDKWNMNSEDRDTDHLQGGALLYVNSDLTEWANSDYRLLNRAPTYQNGQTNYHKADRTGGYDFLLANDVDNSNPVVQAEQLNQLYYLMNWGKVVFGDADANFDGVRVDAVDNVDADLLQLYTDLFEAAYGVNKTEAQALAHISILEAWSFNDPDYNHDTNGAALAIDNGLRMAFLDVLTRPEGSRSNLESLIHNDLGMTDRTVDSAYGDTMPSYAFVRAHDSEVQGIIASIIAGQINPKTDGFTFTLEELQKAFEIYNADMNSVHKKYTHFNIPAAYALLLTNMESVPRVYYGDLFTDNGQYMAVKSPYYNQIVALLKSRIKYAAGGQAMNVQYPAGANGGILTSVRFGKGIMTADQKATDESVPTSGIVTIISNNPNLKLNGSDVIAVQVGIAHAGQYYRPLLSPTENGLQAYLNDSDTNITKLVDENGFIYFTGDEIKGFQTVDMNGFLTVWVPVGAAADQDIRVKPSTEAKEAGKLTYETSAALDSQVIFEGFSNFQDFVKDPSQYTNKVIAENADLFASWGITSFELAPQYVSSTDGTFLDSIIQNGYAFSDRYDLAMSKNNKYGSAEDLRNAIKALHKRGIQVIADWVPDQIYALPGEEIVTATRVNDYGEEREGAQIKNKPYAANTKSSGKDYQAQYGGEFLDYLQKTYPSIFERVMISNGQKIDPSTKIKVWKAEYFNGTNILGKGSDYVLNDQATGTYFTVTENGAFLPKQMTSDDAKTGFYYDGKGMTYFSTSGYQAKSSFIVYNGNRYYFDEEGHMVTGMREIDGETYFFLPNGIELRDAIYEDVNGNQYYFGKTGSRYAGGHYYAFDSTETVDGVTKKVTNWRYFGKDGVMARGLVKIGEDYQYYDENGNQVKGQLVKDKDGNTRYFKGDSGAMVAGEFALINGGWYYFNEDGVAVKGAQTINGQQLYFDENGVQAKGIFVTNEDGTRSYYDAKSGEKFVGDFFTTGDNHWYYADENGNLASGSQVIRGQKLYFAEDGLQAKGIFVTDAEGNRHFYDPDSGDLATNKFIADGDDWYYFDENGQVVTGDQEINGQTLHFDENGVQTKGGFAADANGNEHYYDAKSGDMVDDSELTIAAKAEA
ncbi:glycoside hydrolase family 70 protein [Streptococcus equinus]|uniref:glycoside hydrolase family 70 protein n=1 Tax=Streptococcus equinus TaxID=1335 RepID=UPI0008BE036E|nr:glycoside hydrolase family 70 protein [Streptococcus equinus]SEK33110.1 dextransucrase [Streptococcus equinus]